MNDWFEVKELPGINGMPGTVQNVRDKAKREGWEGRKKAIGKGKEYHVDSLPKETQQALREKAYYEKTKERAREHEEKCKAENLLSAYELGQTIGQMENEKILAKETARQKRKQEGLIKYNQLSATNYKKIKAEARLHVLYALRDFRSEHKDTVGGLREKSRVAFCDAVTNGTVTIPKNIMSQMPQYKGKRTINYKSLQRWEDDYYNSGRWALVPKYIGNGKGTIVDRTPGLEQVIIGAIRNTHQVTPQGIIDYIKATRPELDVIKKRTLQRWLKDWKRTNNQKWIFISNPDQYKSVFMVAFGSHHEQITRYNQLWELDSSPADVMLKDGRHTIIAKIDMFSRTARFYVSKSSTAKALNQLFRKSLLLDGVCEALRTDNGADYISAEFTGVAEALEVPIALCNPFASEEKGTVERLFRTMAHGVMSLLPGYIGHNVAERKAIESVKSFSQRINTPGEVIDIELTAAEFQEKLDQWAEFIYAKNPHKGLDGKTPFEVKNAWKEPIRKIEDERALDALMLKPAGERTVGKNGVLVDWHHYVAPELVSYVDNHRGDKKVRIQYDEQDIGRIYVYEVDGPFICKAECHKLLGTSPQEVATISKKLQHKLNMEAKAIYKQGFKDMKVNMAEAILNHRIEESKNVCELPKASVPYTTAALEEAGKAARSNDGPEYSKTDVDMEVFEKEFSQVSPVAEITRDDPRETYKRWARIEQHIKAGDTVNVKDREGLKRYQQLPEYKSMKAYFELFDLPIDDEEVNKVGLSIAK